MEPFPRRVLILSAVKIIKPRQTETEEANSTSIRTGAISPSTFCTYSTEARARKENRITRDVKRKSERKKSIFEAVSKLPDIDFQAKLAMLGAAKNRKKTGRSITGS